MKFESSHFFASVTLAFPPSSHQNPRARPRLQPMNSHAPSDGAVLGTALTTLFGIRYPILLAGMNVSTPRMAAAVSAAGGLGVIGGLMLTPKMLRANLEELKGLLRPGDKFGVDLLLPQVGGGARATNYDYTKGKLGELVDLVIEFKASLFVSAVGVPPNWVVEKLHANGIVVANMVGSPRHVPKALDAGVDVLIAQGSEAGGHTGDVATFVLVPQIVDLARWHTSPLTGQPVLVVAAGGIFDGRGLAASLCLGAQGVWVGTRFLASTESGAPQRHVDAVLRTASEGTIRTPIYTGRPARFMRDAYNTKWDVERRVEMEDLLRRGIIPFSADADRAEEAGEPLQPWEFAALAMGQACGAITSIKTSKEICDGMAAQAAEILANAAGARGGRL